MCGRYTLTTPLQGVQQVFDFPERMNLAPRTNIAPTQEVPAVRLGPDGGRHLVLLRWGLIPAWAKDRSIASRLINARSETVAEKPSFRGAFAKRRCLVPADGYYEWQTTKAGKQPFRITRADGGVFAMAGLWEAWRDPESGAAVETCCLLTTQANAALAAIHHRMPVILDQAQFDPWLDPRSDGAGLLALLGPARPELLTFYAVSRRVNRVANQEPGLIDPVTPAEVEGPRQGQLF